MNYMVILNLTKLDLFEILSDMGVHWFRQKRGHQLKHAEVAESFVKYTVKL